MIFTHFVQTKSFIPESKTSFLGIKNQNSKEGKPYLLAFDLDGTFLECEKKDIQKFLEIAKSQNIKLTFVSGRQKDEFPKIQEEYKANGIDIPMPDYYLTCNGQFLYENKAGKLVPDTEYFEHVSQTGFERDKYSDVMANLASKLKNTKSEGIVEIKFRPSQFNIEFVVDSKLKKSITKTVLSHLKDNNLQGKVILDYVSPKNTQGWLKHCPPELADKIRPLTDKEGGAVVFNLSATNKGEAVEYLRNKLGVEENRVITAGNAGNDFSMAKSGFIFIMVKNAEKILKELISGISNTIQTNIIKAKSNGLAGINESLDRIFNKG